MKTRISMLVLLFTLSEQVIASDFGNIVVSNRSNKPTSTFRFSFDNEKFKQIKDFSERDSKLWTIEQQTKNYDFNYCQIDMEKRILPGQTYEVTPSFVGVSPSEVYITFDSFPKTIRSIQCKGMGMVSLNELLEHLQGIVSVSNLSRESIYNANSALKTPITMNVKSDLVSSTGWGTGRYILKKNLESLRADGHVRPDLFPLLADNFCEIYALKNINPKIYEKDQVSIKAGDQLVSVTGLTSGFNIYSDNYSKETYLEMQSTKTQKQYVLKCTTRTNEMNFEYLIANSFNELVELK